MDFSHISVLDGLMYGREAYHNPWMLTEVDQLFSGSHTPVSSRREAAEAMFPYVERHLATGAPLHHITRHMLGLYHAQAGGRMWRQILTMDGQKRGAGLEVIIRALTVVEEQAAKLAA